MFKVILATVNLLSFCLFRRTTLCVKPVRPSHVVDGTERPYFIYSTWPSPSHENEATCCFTSAENIQTIRSVVRFLCNRWRCYLFFIFVITFSKDS